MEISFKALADFASLTNNGKLNIMGMFDQLHPTRLPLRLTQMFVVVGYEVGPAEFDLDKIVRVVLLTEDGRQLLSVEQLVHTPRSEVAATRASIYQIMALNGIEFQSVGAYSFSLLVDNDEKGTLPLYVNNPEEPPRTTPGEAN